MTGSIPEGASADFLISEAQERNMPVLAYIEEEYETAFEGWRPEFTMALIAALDKRAAARADRPLQAFGYFTEHPLYRKIDITDTDGRLAYTRSQAPEGGGAASSPRSDLDALLAAGGFEHADGWRFREHSAVATVRRIPRITGEGTRS
jgi:hypothetical protein